MRVRHGDDAENITFHLSGSSRMARTGWSSPIVANSSIASRSMASTPIPTGFLSILFVTHRVSPLLNSESNRSISPGGTNGQSTVTRITKSTSHFLATVRWRWRRLSSGHWIQRPSARSHQLMIGSFSGRSPAQTRTPTGSVAARQREMTHSSIRCSPRYRALPGKTGRTNMSLMSEDYCFDQFVSSTQDPEESLPEQFDILTFITK